MNGTGPASRRVGVFSSGRQDVGYLLPVALEIRRHPALAATVFVSGTHPRPPARTAFHAAGLPCVEVPMLPAGEGDGQIAARHVGQLCVRFAAALAENPVEIVLVLGDRIETLAAAVVAVADRRFLAHIHGGDRAPGVCDDANRHAISKLAHVHFAATARSAERLARLGERAESIHQVGSPGIDGILAGGVAPAAEARLRAGLEEGEPFVLLLYHPAGGGDSREAADLEEICQGIDQAGLRAVCLGPNADPGRAAIWERLRHFSSAHNWPILQTVDRRVFLALMREAVALVGNSSAGMVESAAVGAAVLDVGPRQSGREHSANVLHLAAERGAVASALRRLLSEAGLSASLRSAECVFGDGRAAGRIAAVLADMELTEERWTKLISY